MPEIKLKHNYEILNSIWKKYHWFVFSYLFFTRTLARVFILCVAFLFVIGFMNQPFFLTMAIYLALFYTFYFVVMGLKILLYHFKVMSYYKKAENIDKEFTFRYDETGLHYKVGEEKRTMKWGDFSSFFEYGTEIYLLDGRRKPREIISSKILDNQHFDEVIVLVWRKIKRAN